MLDRDRGEQPQLPRPGSFAYFEGNAVPVTEWIPAERLFADLSASVAETLGEDQVVEITAYTNRQRGSLGSLIGSAVQIPTLVLTDGLYIGQGAAEVLFISAGKYVFWDASEPGDETLRLFIQTTEKVAFLRRVAREVGATNIKFRGFSRP